MRRSLADTASARSGHSEPHTGRATDIGDCRCACGFKLCFAKQRAAVWAKGNAHQFGLVVCCPWLLHPITGHNNEPWHLRFIGVRAATDMKDRGIETLEKHFGLEAPRPTCKRPRRNLPLLLRPSR
ncbi:M15 family metallopeptidase [Arthrobacter sp. U41]|uniref:M15 family metallopeptidase n=1 Tax=Arthrobacter sp. U41 TaxID=1849032 RepID=UPI0009F56590